MERILRRQGGNLPKVYAALQDRFRVSEIDYDFFKLPLSEIEPPNLIAQSSIEKGGFDYGRGFS
jgi:hypothetical protein